MKIIFLLVILTIAHFSQAVSPCQNLFTSLSNWKKPRDTLKFIDIPKTNEEQTLKAQGYGEQFYAGVDEMHYLIRLGNYLRENSIDPHRTHIENFVPLIARHYRHLQEGVKKYYGPTNLGPPQQMRLRLSKIQADLNYRILRNRLASYIGSALYLSLTLGIRKTDQPLSLEAWQKLNLWWSLLMQPKLMDPDLSHNFYLENERTTQSILYSHWMFKKKNMPIEDPIENLVLGVIKEISPKKKIISTEESNAVNFQQYSSLFSIFFPDFPEVIMLPIISALGVFAINQAAGGDRVLPIGLAHRVERHDRILMSPSHIFHNDISHVIQTNYGQPLLGSPLFHQRLTSYFKELSPYKRQQAEIIYLLLTHELRNFTASFPSLDQITDKSSLLKVLSSSFLAENPTYTHQNGATQHQEYVNSLPPEIRAFLTQKDVVIETFDNPQLLEKGVDVFVQAVQHVLQNHPSILQN